MQLIFAGIYGEHDLQGGFVVMIFPGFRTLYFREGIIGLFQRFFKLVHHMAKFS